MKVSLLGLCRGRGKIFIKAHIEKTSRENTLRFESRSNSGTEIPCDSYPPINDTESGIQVITLPILNTAQRLHIEEIDKLHNVVSAYSKTISPFRAKWESRLSYRVKQELTREIKDYDTLFFCSELSMYVRNAISDSSDNILHTIIAMPVNSQVGDFSISCIDSKGAPVPLCPMLLNVEAYSPVKYSPEQVHYVQASIRIPKEIQNYCFALQDSANPENNSFSVLEDAWYKKLLEISSTSMQSAQNDPEYDTWFKEHRAKRAELELQTKASLPERPLFSVIVPLYNTPFGVFCEMAESVRRQSYGNWELILVNASPENNEVTEQAHAYAAADSRIKHIIVPENKGISENTNVGLKIASGDFVCFFDHDDLLEPNILFEYALAINEDRTIDLLYCDEDKINSEGYHYDPFFKPDFNLDLLRNNNYICHLLCIRASLLTEIGFLDPALDGAQDHDLTLRAVEKTQAIHHVSKILYHWRASENSTAGNVSSKSYATEAGIKAVQHHLDRLGLDAQVEQSRRPFTYRVTYSVPQEQPLVSIIIPNKDSKEALQTCITSIVEKSTYSNYEIIVVENNSASEEIFKYYQEISNAQNIRVITYNGEFNFSKIINFGVKDSSAEYLICLNNDTEVIAGSWIERMVGICARGDVGVVGAKLYYPDDTIQHAGVIIAGAVAIHPHRNLPKSNWGYFSLNDAEQDMSAVTAACFMTKRSAFEKVEGFNEYLAVAYNDVDYCLKIRELGLLIVYTPDVELYHYESLSRGYENTKEKKLRYEQEAAYMRSTWAEYYVNGDPYHNKNLCSNDDAAAQYFGLKKDY